MIQEGSTGPEHGGQGNNSLGASVLMEESLRMRKAGNQEPGTILAQTPY